MRTRTDSTPGTRERILDAALDLFGERGLSGTTVRDIAQRAQVNIAAISYHFGGKEGLYRAVANSIAGKVSGQVLSRAANLLDRPPNNPAAALSLLERLVTTIVDVIVGPPEMRRVARFIIREQMQPTAAFDVLFGTMAPLHAAACRLFAAATGVEAEAPETKLRVFMIIGQAIFLRIAEAAVLRRLGRQRFDPATLDTIKALLVENVRAIAGAARKVRR
jgi:AcrR family transcriptional regulator